jgi:uncharacterized protein (DUF305 family)
MIRLMIPALALGLVGSLALAQEAADTQEGMAAENEHPMPMSEDPAMQDLMRPMHDMMLNMPMASSGDADADFLLMMIPHHQSAIEMARVELEQGDDEETRAMAQKVIDAQEAEIAEMAAMLERMGVEPPAAMETVTTDDSGMADEPAASE